MRVSSLIAVSLLALMMLVSGSALELEQEDAVSSMEWTTPEFVELLELDTEAEANPIPVRKPVIAPRPVAPVVASTTRVAVPAPRQLVPTGGTITPIVPLGSPSTYVTADLSATEASVDSLTPDTPLSFSDTVKITQDEAKVKPVPKLAYDFANLPWDDRLSLNGRPVVGAPVPLAVTGQDKQLPNGLCGAYAGATVSSITGNEGIVYQVVKVRPEHAVDPSSLSLSPSASDNTMRTITACAFDKMHVAAKAAGVTIKISSAFRTLGRQQYFWNCHLTKKCNKGRLAARPGRSNHGKGLALDLNQAAPGVYAWLAKNAVTYGFVRTVPTEKWHWEYRPGTPKAKYT